MTEQLPEVHIIGEILHGYKFSSSNAFAKFTIESGDQWDCAGGDQSGQTQVDYPGLVYLYLYLIFFLSFSFFRFNNFFFGQFGSKYIWNHPIDLHYFIKSIDGWPKIIFQVGNLDEYGGKQVFGYGVCYLPTSSGEHEIECPIWRIVGSTLQEAYAFFLDIKPQLRDINLINKTAKEDRQKICTVSVGTIKLKISVLLRNFKKFNLEWE